MGGARLEVCIDLYAVMQGVDNIVPVDAYAAVALHARSSLDASDEASGQDRPENLRRQICESPRLLFLVEGMIDDEFTKTFLEKGSFEEGKLRLLHDGLPFGQTYELSSS